MRILKWIPLLYSILIFGQEDSILQIDPKIEADSLWYKNSQNNFSSSDEFILLGYQNFESSIMGNFGSVLIPFWWKSGSSVEQKIGDRILEANTLYPGYTSVYKEDFPHTKIIYSPTYSDGQRLNFIHKVKYTYGSFIIDYDRLVSEGNLVHEKHQNTRFNFQGNFTHPKIAYISQWRINTFKNTSEWNGGISNDSLFFSNSQSNWQLLPVNWLNLETSIKHKGLDWQHEYRFSEASVIKYEINISQDSLFYEGLDDDTLFYPNRLDSSTTFTRAFSNINHTLKWIKQINKDKKAVLGLKNQNFKKDQESLNRWVFFTSIHSESLKNQVNFSYAKDQMYPNSFTANFTQNINVFGIDNRFKIAYEKTMPNWIQLNSSTNPSNQLSEELIEPTLDQYIEWDMELTKNISIHNTYHNIHGYTYYNKLANSVTSNDPIRVFQSRIKHHVNSKKWHWRGDIGYQNSSSNNIPLAKLLFNQRIYWQSKIFKDATETQIGVNSRYRSSHPGMTYSPILGDFYTNPFNETNASLKCDVFAHFQIQSIKIYASYENFNALWQGEQFTLKPYPIAQPIFRLSLIWNFYD